MEIGNSVFMEYLKKEDGSFGSTQDNIHVIKAITKYLEVSGELDNVSLAVKLRLNEDIVKKSDIDEGNKLETFSHDVDVTSMEEYNSFHVEKSGDIHSFGMLKAPYLTQSSNVLSLDR